MSDYNQKKNYQSTSKLLCSLGKYTLKVGRDGGDKRLKLMLSALTVLLFCIR